MLTLKTYSGVRVLAALMMAVAYGVCDAGQVPVITVTPFMQYFNNGDDLDRQTVVMREQVVAELVSKYDCVVLSSSLGFSLALEDAVKRLSAASEPPCAAAVQYSADLSVAGVFQPGVNGLECVLRIMDLRQESESAAQTTTVKIQSLNDCALQIARAVAGAAGLKQRVQRKEPSDAASCTWVVMPFVFAGPTVSNVTKIGLMQQEFKRLTEVALQKNAQVRLAEHSQSKRVGADRMLAGSLSVESGGGLRLDLFVVCPETTEVLAAVTRRCAKVDSVGAAIEPAIRELLAETRKPSQLTVASAYQRSREASRYLDAAEANTHTFSVSGPLAVFGYVEMAYMKARDNPIVVRRAAKRLCEYGELTPAMPSAHRLELAEVAGKITGADHDPMAGGRDLFLSRAMVYHRAGAFEQGIRLVDSLSESCPDEYDNEMRWLRALFLEAQGKAREALACMEPCGRDLRVFRTRADAYRRLNEDEAEFTWLGKLPLPEMRERLPRYIDLLAKFKGPRAAVECIDFCMRTDRWMSSYSDIQLRLALYSLEAGDQKRAATVGQRLWDEGRVKKWNWFPVVDSEAYDKEVFKKRLDDLMKKAGPSEEKWLKAREVRAFPSSCALYIQPLGALDTNLLEQVRTCTQDFFGARTEVLQPLALSAEEPSYCRGSNKYDAGRLLPDMLKRLKVPEDALSVVLITRETIFADGLVWIYSRCDKNGILCSYAIWQDKHRIARAILLRNAVIGNISNTWKLDGRFPCITAGTGDAGSSFYLKFAYSPEVQDQYRQLDLLAEQRKAIAYFKAAGATIVPAAAK